MKKRAFSWSAGFSVVILGMTLIGVRCDSKAELAVTDEADRHGWIAEAVPDGEEFVASMPPFQLVDEDGRPIVQDNEKANVRQWVNLEKAAGAIPKNRPQQIGDCSSWATKHGIERDQGTEIAMGQPSEFMEVSSMFSYGIARVQISKRRFAGQDGCTVWANAQAAVQYGVLPESDAPPYSGTIARQWGEKGPPADLIAKAAAYKVKTVALLKDGNDTRDAVCNGYGVAYAGRFGSKTFRTRDGRIVAFPDGTTWRHAICIDGYDGSGDQAYFHLTNSWGETAHPEPIDGSPKGGFWVRFEDMDKAIRNADPRSGREWPDTWAFSSFSGFPARDLNFNVWGQKLEVRKDQRKTEQAI